jgi:anti-repressor protein
MNELIRIVKHDVLEQAVYARDLYDGLGLDKSHWVRWYTSNIEKNEFFAEGKDWVGFATVASGNGTRDFAVSIEFAKHLSMMAKTEKAHKYRNYFIECEKRLKQPAVVDPQLNAMILMLTQLDQVKQVQASQQAQINDLKAKSISSPVEYYTIAGYASLRGINVDVKEAAVLGRKAVKISKEMGLDTKKAHSEIFGEVNTYHIDVLCNAFSKQTEAA